MYVLCELYEKNILTTSGVDLMWIVITARKRSLGQGNIFIGVCQEFCSQGGCLLPGRCLLWGLSAPGGCLLWGGVCSWGVLCCGGCLLLGVSTPRGVPGGDTPPWILLQAVRILLECILAGFPLGLENLEKWEGIFQSGKSQGILNRLEKSGKSQGKSTKILEKLGNLK